MALTLGSPFSFALVGAGRVGTAIGELLRRAGHTPVGVASRSVASRRRASDLLGVDGFEIDRLPPCDVVLLGVPDGALAEVAARVGPSLGSSRAAVHFAGVVGVEPLEPVVAAGGWACALHPVQACPDVDTAIARLPGSSWGVTTTPGARQWAHAVVHDALGGRPVDVAEDDRALWHAAAVSTSNGIAALMAISEELLAAIGVSSPEAVLGPLARGTVANAIAGGGGAKTLTGPAVRGELETFVRHLDAISRTAPQLSEGYGLAVKVVVEAARNEGRIEPATAAAILANLERAR